MLLCVCFALQSPDGKYLASGAIDGIINIFDIATGKLLHTLEGKHLFPNYLTFAIKQIHISAGTVAPSS